MKINNWVKKASVDTNGKWKVNGKVYSRRTVSEMTTKLGHTLRKGAIEKRLHDGQTLYHALTTPLHKGKKLIKHKDIVRENTWVKTAVVKNKKWVINGVVMTHADLETMISIEGGNITSSGINSRMKINEMSLFDAITLPVMKKIKNAGNKRTQKRLDVSDKIQNTMRIMGVTKMRWV